MKVLINNVEFAPVTARQDAKIGIAISTHNRPDVLARAISMQLKHLPANSVIFVIDDGSAIPAKVPASVNLIRHPKSLGIVAAKNASLEALMNAGCEHIFLWDDDAWPIVDDWEKPYIDSPEPHLAYQFLDLARGPKLNDIAVLYQDAQHTAYTGQRGVMLYYHRSAIEKVGGFDRIYQRGMYEHSDLALRINNAGLTTWAFADVVNSAQLIYSLDEHLAVNRSVPKEKRDAQVKRNVGIHNDRRKAGYSGYANFRTPKNLVITSLLTSQPDPQRGTRLTPSADMLSKWASSIKGADAVIIADELKEAPPGAIIETVHDVKMNVYFRRWLHIWQYLRDHPEYSFVWCTDGTDVEMLREPWEGMTADKLFVGYESKTYSDEWSARNHPESIYQDFLAAHRDEVMLNAGLLGGSRADVMAFAHGIVRLYYYIESLKFWKMEDQRSAVGDMIAFGIVANRFADKLVYGPMVNTVFKSNGIGREFAWWQHK